MKQLNKGEGKLLGKADLKSVFRNLGKHEMLKAAVKIYQKKVKKGYFFVTYITGSDLRFLFFL